MHHPNAFRFLREQVNQSILIVADFGRYPKTLANLSKDVVAPYVHVVDSFTDDNTTDPYESRSTLLYFRGRTVRKAVSCFFRVWKSSNPVVTFLYLELNVISFVYGMFKEGKVRAKLAKILAGNEDVHYERSYASEDNIKAVWFIF